MTDRVDPRSAFFTELEAGDILCLLPLSRALIEEATQLGPEFLLLPGDAVPVEDLRIVSWPAGEWSEIQRRGHGHLTWGKSAASNITIEDFFSYGILAFPMTMDWDRFIEAEDHEHHLDVIRAAQAKAEAALDVIRFRYCKPTVLGTLPGRAGFLPRQGFSAALFYRLQDHEAYIIAGETVTHDLVVGIGLDFDGVGLDPIADGEVGNIVRHALRLHTAALEASTGTLRFIQYMSLLEYLAAPDAYMGMADVKKPIGRHAARDRAEYDAIMEDFMVLSSKVVDGVNVGYRHNIVHLGRRFEDLADGTEQAAVLRRLWRYAGAVIHDLIRMSWEDWPAVEAHRKDAGRKLGLEP